MKKMNYASKAKVYEKRPEGFSPRVEVAATYVKINNRILFLELANGKQEPGAWGVPAGKLEINETPTKGAKRELFEETGIDVPSEHLFQPLGQLYIRKPDIDYIYHIFEVGLDLLPTIHLSNEHVAYEWVSLQEAEKLPLMNGAKEALNFYNAFSSKRPNRVQASMDALEAIDEENLYSESG